MATNESAEESDSETVHRVTAIEAYWLKSRFQINEDNEIEMVNQESTERVDSTVWKWEYYCSCGIGFGTWTDAKAHLQEIAGLNGGDEE